MRATHPIALGLIALLAAALVPLLPVAPATAEDAASDKYSADELKEIVGPIALYPDIVIGTVLAASTHPTDVVQAAQWIGKQSGEIDGAPEDSGWDESVDALVQYPDVAVWMSENLDWMEQLAWAVDVQQEEVLTAIQAFRKETKDAGNLESNENCQVIENNNVIEVQPASPEIIYVPQYNPVYVTQPRYTGWFWAGFAAGAIGTWAYHTVRWGGGWRGGGSININNSPTYNFNRNGRVNNFNRADGGKRWGSNNVSNRRGNAPRGKNGRPAAARQPSWNNKRTKARPAKGGVKDPGRRPGTGQRPGGSNRPGGNRPGSGNRPGGNRPGSGNRPGGDRPGSGNRPGGDRPGSGNRPGAKPPSKGTRPSKPPSRPSTGNRPSKPPSRPSTGSRPSSRPDRSRPSSSNRSSFGGSNRSGSSTRQSSSRGRSSSSRSSSSRSRSASRGGGGRSRGGGGGRGGGGRRR